MTRLETIAPRLGRAHRQRQEAYQRFVRAKLDAELFLLEEERVLAHRELQFCRSAVAARTPRKYAGRRMRKLQDAQQRVERAVAAIPASWEQFA